MLRDADARLVAVARDATALEPLVKKHGAHRVGIIIGDVTDPQTLQKAVSLAVAAFGRVDAVVANAGVLDPVGPVGSANVGQWRQLYEVNFFSVVELVVRALPELRKTGGRVVAVLSGASTNLYDGWAAYGSSKAALNHFMQSVAEEEKPSGVGAIAIAPGVVDTLMQHDIRNTFGANMKPHALQKFLDLHKSGKLLAPLVPAHVLAQLALTGWGPDLNGKYLRHDDDRLCQYQQ